MKPKDTTETRIEKEHRLAIRRAERFRKKYPHIQNVPKAIKVNEQKKLLFEHNLLPKTQQQKIAKQRKKDERQERKHARQRARREAEMKERMGLVPATAPSGPVMGTSQHSTDIIGIPRFSAPRDHPQPRLVNKITGKVLMFPDYQQPFKLALRPLPSPDLSFGSTGK